MVQLILGRGKGPGDNGQIGMSNRMEERRSLKDTNDHLSDTNNLIVVRPEHSQKGSCQDKNRSLFTMFQGRPRMIQTQTAPT